MYVFFGELEIGQKFAYIIFDSGEQAFVKTGQNKAEQVETHVERQFNYNDLVLPLQSGRFFKVEILDSIKIIDYNTLMNKTQCPVCGADCKRVFGGFVCPAHGQFSPTAKRKSERIPMNVRTKSNRFASGSGCYKCAECGTSTRETGSGESYVELCLSCYQANEADNAASDSA